MRSILLNDERIVLEKLKGFGSNFVTYKAKRINSSFPKGKTVIYKEYRPNDFCTNEVEKDNDCFFEILTAQKSDFISNFLELIDSISLIKEMINTDEIKDNIVDYYEEEITLFDKDFNRIPYKNISTDDKKAIKEIADKVVYYKFVSIYYDDNFERDDFEKLSVTEKIEITILLSNIIKKLHRLGCFHRDIKPDNILFKCDEIKGSNDVLRKNFLVKLLDIDTLMDCKRKPQKYSATEIFSPPEAYKIDDYKYNVQSDIYMIAATLVKLLFDGFNLDSVIVERDRHKFFNYKLISDEENDCEKFLKNACLCTDGFIMKLFDILSKTLSFNQSERYASVEELIQHLIALQEIYENKGVHPEVMLNKAIEAAKNIDFDDIDEDLFTNIKEIRDEN